MKFAFVFPGQGSQSVGMLRPWQGNDTVAQTFESVNSFLKEDLYNLIEQGPIEKLNLTVYTQPAMLASDIALFLSWQKAGGPMPSMMAGHSLGEYAALTAANSLKLKDAVRLVRLRAQIVQSAIPISTGAMAVIIGLDSNTVYDLCMNSAQGEIVEPANFNAPTQIVIAGHKEAVERACSAAKVKGASYAFLLPVSAPFHSSLLRPSAKLLSEALEKISVSVSEIPIINNVDVSVSSSPKSISDSLTRQLWNPVRWVEIIKLMKSRGITHIVECGPGKILTNLTKKIDKSLIALSISDPASLDSTLSIIKTT